MRAKQLAKKVKDEEDEAAALDDGTPKDDALPDYKKEWKCAFTKNTMFSDGYQTKETFEGKIIEVKAMDCTIGGSIVCNLVV